MNKYSPFSLYYLGQWKFVFWGIKYDLGEKYYVPQVWPDWGSNSWPPDYDSTFHDQYISCHWDVCSNLLAISDLK